MKIRQELYIKIVYIMDFLDNTFECFCSLFERLVESVFRIKNMSCNHSINQAVDRNLITEEDLGTNSSTSVVEEMLIGGRGKKVIE